MSNPAIAAYGWTAVPVDLQALLLESPSSSAPARAVSMESIALPSSALATAVLEHARRELSRETYNHSMRVFYYGQAILQHAFPAWSTPSFDETYLLTSLLHDLGTTDANIAATLLSFEFHGGLLALEVLERLGAPRAQAESVAEAVVRHQDLGEVGKITRIGALVQLATIFDNMGENPHLVHRETIEAVVGAYPRRGWSGCFAATIRRENGLKPWAHTTHLGEEAFPEGVEGNKLMAPWDELH